MKLSIAIPTYNRKDFLKKTLDAFLFQIEPDVEIVISDNGSDDGTKEFLLEYASLYPCINPLFLQKNQGIDANILYVFEKACGKYVLFFGDDDLLPPKSLKMILEELQEEKFDLIVLNHRPLKEPNRALGCSFFKEKRIEFSEGEKFFKYAGLGFLSSLILKKCAAVSFISNVIKGRESAHLELASRVALTSSSLLFLGNVSVIARAPENARYILIRSCVIYLKMVYDDLKNESLLSSKTHRFFLRRLVYKEIPRILYKLKESSLRKKALDEVVRFFPKYKSTLMLYSCIISLPEPIYRALFFIPAFFIKCRRRYKLLKF